MGIQFWPENALELHNHALDNHGFALVDCAKKLVKNLANFSTAKGSTDTDTNYKLATAVSFLRESLLTPPYSGI